MIRFIYFLSLFILSSNLWSQCNPMTERDFQSAKSRLNNQFRQGNAFQIASDYGRMYCMTSNQAKEIANFLSNDRDKIDFLKTSFPNILDKENFTDVMDVFRAMSSAFKLYHHTLGSASIQQPAPPQPPLSQNPNCLTRMSSNSFNQLKAQIAMISNDRVIASSILQASQSTCMMTQQISTLVNFLQDENIKLDVLKRLMPQCFDIENYSQLANLLSQNTRQNFLNFLQNPNGTNQSNLNCTPMAESEMPDFIKSVNNQSFDKDKVDHIKTHMKTRCLNTKQIKQIVTLISYDASRLDIAKYLYDNCSDKEKYFVVVETLNFSSSKSDLNEYIKSK